MNTNPLLLSGLLALVVLVGCDDGSATAPKGAPATKPQIAKTEPAKAGPAKVEPAKVEPAKVEPAKVEPAAVPEPAVVAEPEPEPVAEPAAEPVVAEPVVEPEPEPEPVAEPAAVASGDGSTPIAIGPNAELLRLVLAHDVVNRQPVDPATTFPSGQKVSLFVEARNEGDSDIGLSVTWENVKSGRRSPPVRLTIPVRKLHRTRAYRTLKLVGEQRAIVLGPDGQELAVLPFTIE